MRERRSWLRLVLCALAVSCTLAVQAAPIDVADDRGAHLRIARPPLRIVSLLPSLTETVCALGACERLVGVDDYSDWPARVRSLPRVGGLEDARVETIVALKPDLVLSATSSRVLPRLEALGVPVLALEPRTVADVKRVLDTLGPVLGVDPQPVWRQAQQGIAAAQGRLPPALRGTRVYVEVSSAPYAASAGSFIGELLARLGAANIVPAQLGPFPRLNPEFVVRADPQVIIVRQADAAGLRQRPGWARIAALRSGRVCALDAAQADVLMRAGPRIGEAANLLVDCLQGHALAAGASR